MDFIPDTEPECEPSEREAKEMRQRCDDALNSRAILSLHQAGHAVMAEHFKMGVKRVVVQSYGPS